MAAAAIPILALGSLYVMSKLDKDDKPDCKEGFVNMGEAKNNLPNVIPPIPVNNYPNTVDVIDSNINIYKDPHQTTDKFFSSEIYNTVTTDNPLGSSGSGTDQQMSLTGEPINTGKFQHNNMVPFFGGKIKGATVKADVHETILDNKQGHGTHLKSKEECAPMFKPDHNLHYISGAPNMSDFYQSRVNPGSKMANVKPWAEEKVAPGLNKGYNGCGGAGFNSGIESRDRWLPKTVNQLRVDTNPKMTYGLNGHEGPANSMIKSGSTKQTQGNVEKYLPDKHYSVGPSRWFTTTGLEKGQTARGTEILHHVNRTTTSCPYFGNGGANDTTYVQGEYEDPHRQQLPTNPISNASATGQNNANATDYGAQSYTNFVNNRSTTKDQEPYGGVHGAMKAITAPILDILRPARKENAIGNKRQCGNLSTTVSHVPVFNPADRTKTTIREMTEGKLDNNHLNINNQGDLGSGAYLVTDQQSVHVQRDSTNVQNIGNAGPAITAGNRLYDSAYEQRNNPNKTFKNVPNPGGTQIFNQHDNIQIGKVDSDRNNNRMWAPDRMTSAIPSTDTFGKINGPQYLDPNRHSERIEPTILDAFKKNPYAHSLNSWI